MPRPFRQIDLHHASRRAAAACRERVRSQQSPTPDALLRSPSPLRPASFVLHTFLLVSLIVSGWPPVVQAGDILRGGATTSGGGRKNSEARQSAGADAAALAKTKAADRLARTTKAVTDMRNLQEAARNAAGPGGVPDGLTPGGLKVATGANAKWTGALAPVQNGSNVNITQTQSQALLHWETFNVGKNTTVNFDQKAGGNDSGKWIAFNKVFDPSGVPSQIRGKINADGQVYIINQNGIIFGSGSQVNARTLVASSLPINDNLVRDGLLNLQAGSPEFLFSTIPQGGFTPAAPLTGDSRNGDVIVQPGAELTASINAEGGGGRIMLVGANVSNQGTISTRSGQTILAAGLQIGAVGHRKDYPYIPERKTDPSSAEDPSLRGLDVYVGAVGYYAGAVENSGLIVAPTGSTMLVGRSIIQRGVIDSSTSVTLNGRVDLLANYGATVNPNYNPTSVFAPPFIERQSGTVVLGDNSVIRILPELASAATTVGTKLPLASQVNIQGSNVLLGKNSITLAPSGNVAIGAGQWRNTGLPEFVYESGQVFMDQGAILDISGSTAVFVPISNSILNVQLRGNELAPSPLQRDGSLRGTSLTIDTRRTGTYQGRSWVGTPLGDASGFLDIVPKDVGQLSAAAGSIVIGAGEAFVQQKGATIDVSGGYFVNEGGAVKTSRLVYQGRNIIKIEDATPDRLYDGIYSTSSSRSHPKWGVTLTWGTPLAQTGEYNRRESIQGAPGGELNISAPGIVLDGELLGHTVVGPQQIRKSRSSSEIPAPASLALNLTSQVLLEDGTGIETVFTNQPSAPRIILGSPAPQVSTLTFVPDQVNPLPADRLAEIHLKSDFFAATGFGVLAIENSEGNFAVPAGASIELPPEGRLSVTGRNIDLAGSIRAPGGILEFTAYNLPRYKTQINRALNPTGAPLLAPVIDPTQGTIQLSSTTTLNASGLIVDDRSTALKTLRPQPFVLDGGDISLIGYNVILPEGSLIDVSGGLGVTSTKSYRFGNAGTITVRAGQDVNYRSIIGGKLQLEATLLAYSGDSGGTLNLTAPFVQVSGTRLHPDSLLLSPDFFSQGGFTRFNITGIGAPDGAVILADPNDPDAPPAMIPGVYIAPGTTIAPTVESLAFAPFAKANDGSPRLLARKTRPLGERSPISLNFASATVRNNFTREEFAPNGNPGEIIEIRGDIVVGQGSRIITEPGGSIGFDASTVTLLGEIQAPGGQIIIKGADAFPLNAFDALNASFGSPTVYIGPSARLSAAGASAILRDEFGRRGGTIYSGGSISVQGNIVASAGAVLDVSGASGTLDIHPSRLAASRPPKVPVTSGVTTKPFKLRSVPFLIESDGGMIKLAGSQMLFSDATLLGAAGGPTAIGGSLSISSGGFYGAGADIRSSDVNLTVSQSDLAIPATTSPLGIGRPIRDARGSVVAQRGYFAVDRFTKSGLDAIDLGTAAGSNTLARGGNIEFKGPVDLVARGPVRLASGGIITADSSVRISAPYISMGQVFRVPTHPDDPEYLPFEQFLAGLRGTEFVAPESGPGSISFNAPLIDVGNTVFKGVSETTLSAPNGDIRGNGALQVAGTLNLAAGQIYPTTLATFDILAIDSPSSGGVINITKNGAAAAPLSAGGTLNIYASTVRQGGVLVAPFGAINIGWDGLDLDPSTAALDTPVNTIGGTAFPIPVAKQVTLNTGSLTSVAGIDFASNKALLVPFGLSPDGILTVDPRGINIRAEGLKDKIITIGGDRLDMQAGAIIDLRGGGDLLSSQWIPGLGGAIDLLSEASSEWGASVTYQPGDLVSYEGETFSARVAINPSTFTNQAGPEPGVNRYWTQVAEAFAVVPGYQARFAPYAAFNTGMNAARLGNDPGYVSSSLGIGDQIYLDAGSGLPAGHYTLLPKKYALLPGAFVVTPQSFGPFGSYGLAEGSTIVTGYRSNSLNAPAVPSGLRSIFEVAPPGVVAGRSEYAAYTLNNFLTQAASDLELTEVQRLAQDSGYLLLSGNNAMALSGTVLSRPLSSGRGSRIDIASQQAITIADTGGSTTGGVVLGAGSISAFASETLILGGRRYALGGSTYLEVRSPHVTLANAQTPLTGSDVTLVARQSMNLAPGVLLVASGSTTQPAKTYNLNGNGVAVRASSDETASVFRSGVTSNPIPRLTIGSSSTVSGAGVTLDSSYGFDLDPAANIVARNLTLAAGQIGIFLNGPSPAIGQVDPAHPQLLLGGIVLDRIQQSRRLNFISYQSSIDIYGPGTFGRESLASLSLQAGEIRGFNQGGGASVFTSGSTLLSNSRGVGAPGPLALISGSLVFNSTAGIIGIGDLRISQFGQVIFNAAGGIHFEGKGSLAVQNDFIANTPALTTASGARHGLSAGGTIDILQAGSATLAPGLGSSLTIAGSSVTATSNILLPSGLLDIRATGPGGSVVIGGRIDTRGQALRFYDQVKYTDGGEVRLSSESGDLTLLATSNISVASAPGGGSAGFIVLRTPAGQFTSVGSLEGGSTAGERGGSFDLDALRITSLDNLRDILNSGGFSERRYLRARTGNLVLAGTSVAKDYTLIADAGSITVTGSVDARGMIGGRIALIARNNLTLQSGSVLTVAARQFSNAGKGGTVYLEAGASALATAGAGSLDIQAGSLIDLSVAAFRQGATALPNGNFTDSGSSAFLGQFQGTLHLRAPQVGGNTDLAVNTIQGRITGASSILAEGYRIYDRTGSAGVMNIALRNQLNADASSFVVANEAAMRAKLLGGTVNAGLDAFLVVAPGSEIVNTAGDLILGAANPTGSASAEARSTADWDLSNFRYGTRRAPGVLTLRASGDIRFNNALSDGFSGGSSTTTSGHSALWLADLQTIDLDGLGDPLRPINLQSWSYRITAGADLASASSGAVVSGANSGSVYVGEFYAPVPNNSAGGGAVAVGGNGLTANSLRMSTTGTDRGTRYEVIRTGTGSIEIASAVDVQLRNQFAAIYTAGVRIPEPQNLFGANDFRTPDFPNSNPTHPNQGSGLGAIQQIYGPIVNIGGANRRVAQYATGGGSIQISAGRDIGRYTLVDGNVIKDSSRQMPTNWLYRRGYVDDATGAFGSLVITGTTINDPSASTTWWVDYSNFFQGVGALGGGDVTVQAARNIENLDAFSVTNARMSGRDSLGNNIAPNANLLLELGGGDLDIVAGNNIDGGVYYVERGAGLLQAGGEIKTNEARSPSLGYLADISSPSVSNSLTWLPTSLFLGKGSFDVKASGDILLGPITNTFLQPQGLNNKFWYKTYFSSYSPDSTVRVTSVQGNITHRNTVLSENGARVSPLQLWLSTQNLNIAGSEENASYYQPWIRLAETDVGSFATVTSLLPPKIYSTALSGNINIQGDFILAPSASGTLELVASGHINGLVPVGISGTTTSYASATINVSDADPSSIFGITTPRSQYQANSALNALRISDTGIFDGISAALSESGSFAGIEGSIGRKGARHSSRILHASDPEPIRIYAGTGDISGFTLFTPKVSQIVAGRNITDIAFYLQNANSESISIVSAGKNILPFNENSPLRVVAESPGNLLLNVAQPRIDGTITTAMAGDLQINGPGVLEVLAGRDIDLGGSEKFSDGTGAGISSIGRSRNPFLSFDGARLIVLAGLEAAGGGPALGLRQSSLSFERFISEFVKGSTSYNPGQLTTETLAALQQFDGLSEERQAITALDVFYSLLRSAADEQATSGSYASGFAAIDALFGSSTGTGDIFTRTRDIRTTSGGAITIAAPGGELTMASTLATTTLTPPGIVTEFGGPVDILLSGDLDIGATRIFTLRGGDLTIWSSAGNIAAGSAAKTIVTAPPTRVSLDATSGEVLTDLGGLATGGGIGVLASVDGVEAGSVFLIAPFGAIDAGDAGIRATGDITLAASEVLNADNIAAGGTSVGVPTAAPVAAPNIGGLTSGSSSSAAASTAAASVTSQSSQQPQETVEVPSVISVEVLGYGGGEDEG